MSIQLVQIINLHIFLIKSNCSLAFEIIINVIIKLFKFSFQSHSSHWIHITFLANNVCVQRKLSLLCFGIYQPDKQKCIHDQG